MKRYNLVAMMLGAVLVAAPIYAGAAQEGGTGAASSGTVCGRVNAPSSYILQLEESPTHDNVIVARSESEEVQTTVNVDGTFCFKDLATNLHTLTAFNDGLPQYTRTIMPLAGQTLYVQLTATTSSL